MKLGTMFLNGKNISKCCNAKTIIVKYKTEGLVTQNCVNCGDYTTITKNELPELDCPICNSELEKIQKERYYYRCNKCDKMWELYNMVPDWKDLSEYWGLKINRDGTWKWQIG